MCISIRCGPASWRRRAGRACSITPGAACARGTRRYWGSQAFAEKLLALVPRAGRRAANRNYRSAPAAHRHNEKHAENLLTAGLATWGLGPGDLVGLRGDDPRKVAIAQQIRQETTVPNGWLAERLAMRSAANVSQILRRAKEGGGAVKICRLTPIQTPNSRLEALGAPLMAEAEAAYAVTPQKQRIFHWLDYVAGTWDRERRVIAKAEFSAQGKNPRFVVTSLEGDAAALYDEVYCGRGEMENRIKEQQLGLFSDALPATPGGPTSSASSSRPRLTC